MLTHIFNGLINFQIISQHMALLKAVTGALCSRLTRSSLIVQSLAKPLLLTAPASSFHSSVVLRDLSEFFEHEKFRGEKTIRVGREWR